MTKPVFGFRDFDTSYTEVGVDPALPPGVTDQASLTAWLMQEGNELDTTNADQVLAVGELLGRSTAQPLGVPPEDYAEVVGSDPYTAESPYRLLQGLATDPAEYARLQDVLLSAGLLTPEQKFTRGRMTINDPTIGALQDVMEFANNSGTDINGALRSIQKSIADGLTTPEEIAGQVGGQAERGRFYVLPDYATLRSRVRGMFEDSLGRAPTQAEMRLFTDEMMADYKTNAQAEQAAFSEVGAGRDVFFNEVDPVVRFEESFRERLAGQIESVEDQKGARQGAARAAGAVEDINREVGL